MKTLVKGKQIFLMIFAISLIATTGCKKDRGPVPTIPPKSTMQMNLTEIDSTKTGRGLMRDTTYNNYLHAAGNFVFWNVVLTINLAVPVLAFCESFNHDVEWNKKEKKWIWTYDFYLFAKYTATLKAKVTGSDVHWEMFISQEKGFQDVLWFTGDSKVDGTAGEWHLNYNASNPSPYIDIIWHKNASNDIYDIRYTNVIASDAGNGSYIEYGVTANTPYNGYYTIFDKAKNNTLNIEANLSSHDGHVKDPLHFGDNLWHCWGTDYKNMVCQ
ncbi:MAG: hypothetical protein PHD97_08125 [Bacteroidales bacterium]|nr:hypothetical protein [Bacteroidales bacterium]